MDAKQIRGRVEMVRMRHHARDRDYMKLIAIRRGDYDAVAPGLFNTRDFDKPLVANLIDTTARDIAEVMAPLPTVNCTTASLSNESDSKRQDLRSAIANGYVQNSRLQDQMFGGADRYVSFGFLALVVEPHYADKMPVLRVDDAPMAYYTNDYLGRTRNYFTISKVPCDALCEQMPSIEAKADLRQYFQGKFGTDVVDPSRMCEVVRWYDDTEQSLVLLDDVPRKLFTVPNPLGRCPVRIVERPKVQGSDGARGQFDDVIWVQVARAMVQMYTMNALEQSVNAPIQVPQDATELEMGPFATIQTDGTVQRVNLNMQPGLFPESQLLAQEQRLGSRYPEGRSGNIDASIITGQGVQALMGTFDTQIQTFQRLFASGLEDALAFCFEMDEALWGNTKKTKRIKDNGAPRKYDYTPSKDIKGDYTVDVSYGAIAGLDPNRGLVFVLQALAGGLLSKKTSMKTLPVDLNVDAEERQIQMEGIDDSIAASLAMLPQAIPQMATNGMDPRELVLQVVELRNLVNKGKTVAEAMEQVFAPKQPNEEVAEPPTPLDQAQGAGAGPAALPGAGQGGASDMLMSLAGLSPRGGANLQSNVSRMRPAAG